MTITKTIVWTPEGYWAVGTDSPTSTFHVGGSMAYAYVEKAGTYTLTDLDYLVNCTSGTFTVTLPTAVGITGRAYNVKNTGNGVITVATTSSQLIDGVSTQTLQLDDNIKVLSTGSNWIIL